MFLWHFMSEEPALAIHSRKEDHLNQQVRRSDQRSESKKTTEIDISTTNSKSCATSPLGIVPSGAHVAE
uniref:Ovule protein n=1 Tax=Steinernema glaseri TaxID=37863 RepID=A0A1I7YZK0_9BILA